MKFDEILFSYLGEFGKYQKIQFFLVCVPTIFTAMHALSWTFTSAIPDHRCKLPGEDDSVPFNLSAVGLSLSIPEGEEESKCSRFVGLTLNASEELDTINLVATEHCKDGMKYNLSDLKNTAITRWDIVCDHAWIRALVQSMYYIGQFFGSFVFGLLGDKIGRKKVFFVAILLQITCGSIMAFVPYWQVFGLLRVGLGFSHPGIFVIAVVIGSELVGPSKRRFAGVVTGVFFTIGQVILGLLAYALRDYQYIQLAISLPALVFVAYWWIVPESARWLVSKKKYEEADKILQKAARVNNVQLPSNWHEDLDSEVTKTEPAAQSSGFQILFDLFRTPKIRRRTLIAWFCWPVVSMVYYGLSMNPSFLGGDRYLVFILAGAMEIPGLVFVFFTVDILGRKTLCCGGYLIASLCLFATLIIPDSIKWLQIAQVVASKSAITAVYAVIYTFTPELFPTVIRNTAMGCCSMIARVGAVSASYISMWLAVKNRLILVLLFAPLALAASFLCLLLPETAGRVLPESIDDVESQRTFELFDCCKKPEENTEENEMDELKKNPVA